ncbi:GAF domain-containing sensor histidine kinase [Natronosalvus rutilus]|uniref:histidine kinase n=1 Tax=Natronosalvus rutilus TaxID=2953753 RepID=A0A9E7N795_9EURY|nr:ATP-binding protein [Natronosalvus rutilus]UTF53012.1 ATP-binding protein [Natronosalvus rutilus]
MDAKNETRRRRRTLVSLLSNMVASKTVEFIGRLGDIATTLDASTSVESVYEHALTAAADVLSFEAASICTQRDERLIPRAVYANHLIPGQALSANAGIAGRTLATGATILVDDLRDETNAAPTCDSFRSVLSVPIANDGIFQAFSSEPDAFSDLDRQIGETLVAIVVNARTSVEYEAALETERDRFAALFENVSDAAVQYRIEGERYRIERVNSAFVRVFGRDAESIVGESIADVLEAPGDGADEPTRTPLIEHAPDGETETEVIRNTPSGPRPFLRQTVPIATDDETTRGYRIYTDLTALKVRERELERQNERLDQFASIVSHDLRNPLTVANGYLGFVRDELGDDHDAVTTIQQAHDRMEQLIDDVLAVARKGDETGNLELVRLSTVAEQAWEHVDTRDARLELDDGGVWVDADPTRLLQLFENLFRNSVEHGSALDQRESRADDAVKQGTASVLSESESGDGPPGTRGESAVYVRVGTCDDGFAVEDDGPGIPPSEREVVFDSGYSTGSGSTGLGLAIVERIADEHGWSVECTDGSAGGARFEFTGVYLTSESAVETPVSSALTESNGDEQ